MNATPTNAQEAFEQTPHGKRIAELEAKWCVDVPWAKVAAKALKLKPAEVTVGELQVHAEAARKIAGKQRKGKKS